jgi:hypothetical protein
MNLSPEKAEALKKLFDERKDKPTDILYELVLAEIHPRIEKFAAPKDLHEDFALAFLIDLWVLLSRMKACIPKR